MLKALMAKIDNIASISLLKLYKNQMEMLEIKDTVEHMKNAMGRLINRHDILKKKN